MAVMPSPNTSLVPEPLIDDVAIVLIRLPASFPFVLSCFPVLAPSDIKGTGLVFAPSSTPIAKWNPDAPIFRLRWVEDGIWFEMTKFGDVEAIEYLDQAGMIALAESLVYSP